MTVNPPGRGLRERKKAQTRQAIGLTAMRMAVDQGLENVRVEDIAAEVGVSARTFNNYFTSKYEAICALAVDRARQIGDDLRARSTSEPFWDSITYAVLQQYGTEVIPDKGWAAGVRLVTSEPALVGEYLKAEAEMRQMLAEAISERLTPDADELLPRIVAGAVVAATDAALSRWLEADPPVPLRPLVRRALRHLADGLVVPVCPDLTDLDLTDPELNPLEEQP